MDTVRLDDGLLAHHRARTGSSCSPRSLPGVRSAAIGIWVRTASAHEPREQMGISHLLEHMVFKGTERRTAKELALELEVRGGSLDAFTGRDHTSYQAHVLDADLPLAVEVLTDLVRRPLLRESDLELERNVILEEINGVEDTPDDLVFELHAETLWPDHPYGYSILGTPETLGALSTQATSRRSIGTRYYRGNCVIAAAGNVDHEQLLTGLEREGWFEAGAAQPVRPSPPAIPARRGICRRETRDTAQTHVVFGTDTFPLRDPRRLPAGHSGERLRRRHVQPPVPAGAGGAGSRLRGLRLPAASICPPDTGRLRGHADRHRGEGGRRHPRGVSTGSPARACRRTELANGKQQLKGQIMLSLESPLGADGPSRRLRAVRRSTIGRSTRCWRRSTR